jgi:hypothetical protein
MRSARNQGRQHTQRRQARHVEIRPAAESSVSGETLEVIGVVRKRDASVARAVLMTALETLARVAKQKRPRCHQRTPRPGPVLKCAGRNNGNRNARVLFFKGTVLRAGRTDKIGDRPTIAAD